MAVAEGEADGVVADEGPVYDGDARELFAGVAAVPAAQDVWLADIGGARGGGAEKLCGEEIFGAVCPANGELFADNLKVLGCLHGLFCSLEINS